MPPAFVRSSSGRHPLLRSAPSCWCRSNGRWGASRQRQYRGRARAAALVAVADPRWLSHHGVIAASAASRRQADTAPACGGAAIQLGERSALRGRARMRATTERRQLARRRLGFVGSRSVAASVSDQGRRRLRLPLTVFCRAGNLGWTMARRHRWADRSPSTRQVRRNGGATTDGIGSGGGLHRRSPPFSVARRRGQIDIQAFFAFVKARGKPILAALPQGAYGVVEQTVEAEHTDFMAYLRAGLPGTQDVVQRVRSQSYRLLIGNRQDMRFDGAPRDPA